MFLCRFELRVQVRYVIKEALLVCIFLLSVVSTPFLNVFTSPTARKFMTKAKAKSEIPLSEVHVSIAMFRVMLPFSSTQPPLTQTRSTLALISHFPPLPRII